MQGLVVENKEGRQWSWQAVLIFRRLLLGVVGRQTGRDEESSIGKGKSFRVELEGS